MAYDKAGGLTLQIDRIVAARELKNDNGFLLRGINENAWKMFYLERGAMTANMGTGERLVRSGHAVFCAPQERYSIEACGQQLSDVLVLSFESTEIEAYRLHGKMVPISTAMKTCLQAMARGIEQSCFESTTFEPRPA